MSHVWMIYDEDDELELVPRVIFATPWEAFADASRRAEASSWSHESRVCPWRLGAVGGGPEEGYSFPSYDWLTYEADRRAAEYRRLWEAEHPGERYEDRPRHPFTLEKANDVLREAFLPALREQLNAPPMFPR